MVDVQERLAPAIPGAPHCLARIAALLDAAGTAGLPILATEQYSRGLGRTLPALRRRLSPDTVIEKIHFAAPREAAFKEALQARSVTRWIVVGMEAHVCVMQTVLRLLERPGAVTVVRDAVASRVDADRRTALARMVRAGASLADSAELLGASQPAGPSGGGALSG